MMLLYTFLFFLLGGQYDTRPTNLEIQERISLEEEFNGVFLSGCETRSNGPGFNRDPDSISYFATKASIYNLRKRLGDDFRNGTITMDSIKYQFKEHLVNKLIPYWYDTPWSFGGHSAVPKQGEIACGYFISTTLRDMGLNLNRYKLAQKGPLDEAKSISCGSLVTSIVEKDSEQAFEKIDQQTTEGVYFIGFDEGHVGYLVKNDGELLLAHSNYFYPAAVRIEPLKNSRVFQSFDTFHLVDISNNDLLLQRWLNNETVL